MWTLAPTLRAVLQCSSPCGTFCRSLSVANQSGCSADKRNTWVAEDSMRAECDIRREPAGLTGSCVCILRSTLAASRARVFTQFREAWLASEFFFNISRAAGSFRSCRSCKVAQLRRVGKLCRG